MRECPLLKECPFFNDRMVNMPSTAEIIKKNHCQSYYTKCARYIVLNALGKEKVPSDLFPTQTLKAGELIKFHKNKG